MKNGEPEPSSSYRRMLSHVHLNHSEEQHSHYEQQEEQPEERLVAQEQ
jgi:hypothetical protein